ncbi:hypothetical protein [Microbacterium sp. H6]|uniref:ApeA N-terminal domain 1-containing protein n=1 Tax=Microbacterium sp. H6 TaxID=421122 RepID=UPI000DE1C091|nr:hypothetical protein [Microbacterium sp. H6]RBO70535.1 hypothetical protein DSP71_21480 [Microbacterium sp. H6]
MALTKHIEADKAYAGLLIDGVDGTPYVVATLTLTPKNGLLVEVPYMMSGGGEQFSSAKRWFESDALPDAFQFKGDDLEVTLYGCRVSGRTRHFGRDLAVGRFVAASVVLGMRTIDQPFAVDTIRSRVDGLREWTGFTATRIEHHTNDYAITKGLTIRVESTADVSWEQGAAAMSIGTDWEGREPGAGVGVDEWVTLSSTFDPPQPPAVHLATQRVVRDLLVLVFGTPLRFRHHQVQDSTMPSPQYFENAPIHLPFLDLVLRETTWDRFQPSSTDDSRERPIASADSFTAHALAEWAGMQKEWSRAIQPLVSLLNREWFTAEDVIVGANISLEAIGHLLDPVEGEHVTYRNPDKPKTATTATYVLRALHAVPTDLTRFRFSIPGLARLVADTYNSIKHYNRPQIADDSHIGLIADVSQLVARLAILTRLPGVDDAIAQYCADYQFENVMNGFERLRVEVSNDGELLPWSGSEPQPPLAAGAPLLAVEAPPSEPGGSGQSDPMTR